MVRLEKMVLQGFKSFKRKVAIPFPAGFSVITGPNGSGKCLSGDTVVALEDGSLIRIDELVEKKLRENPFKEMDDGIVAMGNGTMVLSLDFHSLKVVPCPVKGFVKRKSPSSMVRIKTRSGREVKATEYHPFFTLNGKKIDSVRAGDLREGVRIAVPRRIPVEPKTRYFFELLDLVSVNDRIYVPWRRDYALALKGMKKTTWKKLADMIGIPYVAVHGLLNKQAINFAHLVKILRYAALSDFEITKLIPVIKSGVTSKKCKMIWRNSPEFARFLGYLLAEGRLPPETDQIWFVNGTQEIVEDYYKLITSLFGIHVTINEYKTNTYDIIGYSHPLRRILAKFGMLVGGAKDKKLTNLFLAHASEKELAELMNGLYSGDGYVSKSSIEITTKSPELGWAVENILTRLGITHHSKYIVKVATNSGFSGIYKIIRIYGVGNFRVFSRHIVLAHPKKKRRIERLLIATPNPNVDLLEANSLVKEVVKDLGIGVKPNRRIFHRLDAYSYNQCLPSAQGIRHLIENIFIPSLKGRQAPQSLMALTALAYSDVFWDEITGIERIQPENEWVYDLSIDENHNYIANNFFVHNSNLAEAVTFVLGERASRTMRAKRGQELIFHGSKAKSGSDYAHVILHFENGDKKIPVEEASVTASRRINKKGVSTYRINGRVVTRQQIVDMLSQAGIHSNGHNIIQQGDVNQIVEMDAVQRRQILDEISGILEYDEKKEKALKELERIAEKVREAEIIISEKTNIIERLRKDRDAAITYKNLEQDLERIKSSIVYKDYSGSKKEMEAIAKEIEEKSKAADGLEGKIRDLDKRLVVEEKNLENLTKSVIQASSQLEVSKRIARLQAEIEKKKSHIDFNSKELERIESFFERIKGIEEKLNPAVKAVLKMPGVDGVLSELIEVPKEYQIAAEVAGAGHLQDIVVDTTNTAVSCVKFLKDNKIGRARFLPLDKIRSEGKSFLPKGAIGWISGLIHFDAKFSPAVEFVFGRTAAVQDIETAKRIMSVQRVRMVTLDGDLVEPSGAIFGGFYTRKRSVSFETNAYADEKRRLRAETEEFEKDIAALSKELNILAEKEKKTGTFSFEKERVRVDESLTRFREERKKAYEKRLILQQEIGKLNINKARLEAKFDNLKVQWSRGDIEKQNLEELRPFINYEINLLRQKEKETIQKMNMLGPINMKAVEEFDSLKEEFEEFREKVEKIIEEKNAIEETITKIEERRMETFMGTLSNVSRHFKEVYKDLTGGEAELSLENPKNLETGLLIKASPPGKKLLNLDSMSGGEKTLTAFAFLFALQKHKPAPFYVLDEADATLDKVNTKRVANLIKKQSRHAQFILISHNDNLVKEADQVYGVTMEDGESKVLGVELPPEEETEEELEKDEEN